MRKRVGLFIPLFMLFATHASAIQFFHRTDPIEHDYALSRRELGKGNSSKQVILGINRHTGERVAIKEVAFDKTNYLRVNREPLLLRYLASAGKHDHIVGFVDSYVRWNDDESGTIYLVMELIQGEDFLDYIQRKQKLSNEKAITLASQISSAIRHLQKMGIAHRDIKPDNMKITPEGKIVILDLGMAKFFNRKKEWRDTDCGSPHYVPPEIYRDVIPDLAKRDAFSMGVTLYAMVTGRFPWYVPFSPISPIYRVRLQEEIASNRFMLIHADPGQPKQIALANYIHQLLNVETHRADPTTAGKNVLEPLKEASIQFLVPKRDVINLRAVKFILEYIKLKELAVSRRDAVRSIVESNFEFVNKFYTFLTQVLPPSPLLDIAFINDIKEKAGKNNPSRYSIVKFFVNRMDVTEMTKEAAITHFLKTKKKHQSSSQSEASSSSPIPAHKSSHRAQTGGSEIRIRKHNSDPVAVGQEPSKKLVRHVTESKLIERKKRSERLKTPRKEKKSAPQASPSSSSAGSSSSSSQPKKRAPRMPAGPSPRVQLTIVETPMGDHQ